MKRILVDDGSASGVLLDDDRETAAKVVVAGCDALPDQRGQHGTTVHLMPEPAADGSLLTTLRECFDGAASGSLDHTPPLRWYLHSTLDPSLSDAEGRHPSALFVQGVPPSQTGSDWATERAAYVERTLDLVERYAPDLRRQLVEVQSLAPTDIETYFGITHGTSTTSTPHSPSPTECHTPLACQVCTPRPLGVFPVAPSSVRPVTTPRARSSATSTSP